LIDAFWVQRQIADIYPDPKTAAEKASKVMSVLGSESNLRDCEDELMDIFEHGHFRVIIKFLGNRDVVVRCTKLARGDANGRMDVGVAMREGGLGWILRGLSGDRQVKARTDAMVVDEGTKQTVPKTANIAPGSTVQPKATVDLESMAFSQSGHLMSNKKCKLPEGSFKRTRKSYKIHAPAPKQKPVAPGDLVPIDELPPWARKAFSGTKTLNRVQSTLYPIAFGTDNSFSGRPAGG
jgi:pre-mRNA-splicing helicase BRR2